MRPDANLQLQGHPLLPGLLPLARIVSFPRNPSPTLERRKENPHHTPSTPTTYRPRKRGSPIFLLLILCPLLALPARPLSTCELPAARWSVDTVKTTVVYQAVDFRTPVAATLTDDMLVVLTPYSDPAVRMIDLIAGTMVNSVRIQTGGFLRSVIVGQDTVWIADTGRQEVVGIPVADLRSPIDSESLTSFSVSQPFSELVAHTSSGYFFSVPTGNGAHFVTDRTGIIVSSDFQSHRELPQYGIRPYGQAMALAPSRDWYVAAGRWGSTVTIHPLDGRGPRELPVPHAFSPDFAISNRAGHDTVLPGRESRVAYVDVLVTATTVYALFSGKRHFPAGVDAAEAIVVQEFRDSRLVASFVLDQPVRSFTHGNRDRHFYALAWGDPPSVVEFTLPADPVR